MLQLSTVLSIAVGLISVVSILIGVVSWCFKIVTRVSIIEVRQDNSDKTDIEIKDNIKLILEILRENPQRR